MVTIKSKSEIEKMREACKIAALTQKAVEEAIKPGVSTYELDKIAEQTLLKYGAISAEKNYPSGRRGIPNFPGNICVSINDVVIHGIPSKKEFLKDGDIISVDIVALKDGFHGDCARTYPVGNISDDAKKLIEVTKNAFFEGVKDIKSGSRVGDISSSISEFVWKNDFDVIREFQGHGIGKEMHEEPGVPNFGKKGRGMRLEAGMTIAVEPMVVAGEPDIYEDYDGWSIITEDGELAAHYENTILITEKGVEILTII